MILHQTVVFQPFQMIFFRVAVPHWLLGGSAHESVQFRFVWVVGEHTVAKHKHKWFDCYIHQDGNAVTIQVMPQILQLHMWNVIAQQNHFIGATNRFENVNTSKGNFGLLEFLKKGPTLVVADALNLR